MYKANVNKGTQFQVDISGGDTLINNELFEWDIRPVSGNLYHAIYKGTSYRLEVVNSIPEEKKFVIKINGRKSEIQLRDGYDLLLEKLGMADAGAKKINQVLAPMPGLILEIKVQEGTEVKKGDPVLILEAMKMENILKSPGEGTVKSIKVKKGESVEKNQVLILF